MAEERQINYESHHCLICKKNEKEYFCKNRRSLGNHLSRSHKPYNLETYTLEFFFNEKIPLCLCGCQREVKWHKLLYRYNDYITGHNDRFTSTNQPVLNKSQKEDLYKKTVETTKSKYGENFYLEISRKAHTKNTNFQNDCYFCKICNIDFKNETSLRDHIAFFHSMKIENYILKTVYNGKRPLCLECGEETRFDEKEYKYKKYCKNHANLGKREWSLKNSKLNFGWKKGETKDTHSGIKKHSIKVSGKGNGMYGKRHESWIYDQIVSKRKDRILLTEEEFEKRKDTVLEKHKLKIISSYEDFKKDGVKTFLDVSCTVCNTKQLKNLWYMMTDDCSCIQCKKIFPYSKWEYNIGEFIEKELKENIDRNNREIISPKEIDIVISSNFFGIEAHGLFFHSKMKEIIFQNSKYNKHELVEKTNRCKLNGYSLFHIFEDEWKNKKDIVKSMIKYKLGKIDNRVYARNCSVKELDWESGKLFFEDNHISGSGRPFKKGFGLFKGDVLLAAISFGLPLHKNKYDSHIEIYRFCSKLDTVVVGGFSKLLKFAINNWIKKEGLWNKILTYADMRFSGEKNLYIENKFTLSGKTSKPSFWYTDGKKRINRTSYINSKDAENDGFFEIHGCKSLIYEMEIS